MILELADIRIQPGKNAEFEVAIEHGVKTIIAQAQGFQGWKVNRCIETPERYVLQIFWETLEDHTERFRNGPLFPQCNTQSFSSLKTSKLITKSNW